MTTTLAPAPAQHAAPDPDPITPQPGIPFGRLLRVEWGKATDTRSARWLIAIVAVATVGLMLAPLLGRHSIDQSVTKYLSFSALAITVLLPVVAIMTLTGEWSQRTVLTTFTQEPRRVRVTNAKVLASMIMGALAVVFAALVTTGAVAVAELSGRHIVGNLGAIDVLGFVLFIMLNMLMGVAFGALLHNTAAAIVFFFALPAAFSLLGSVVHSLGDWLDPGQSFNWILGGEWHGHAAMIATALTIWLVLPLIFGLVRTVRREIK
jgi:ABC-2 type transport system permease protein